MNGNQLTTIESNTFEFNQTSNVDVHINLNSNLGLTGDSFKESFISFNRNTTLYLEFNPGLKYLKKSVFHPFLDTNQLYKKVISLYNTPLEYYQDNKWLLEYRKLNSTDKIISAKMIDGVKLWESDENKFTEIRKNV